MRISDWSSDVSSSDLVGLAEEAAVLHADRQLREIGHVRADADAFVVGPHQWTEAGQQRALAVDHLRIADRHRQVPDRDDEIGRAHVCTPVPNAHLVYRLLLGKNNTNTTEHNIPNHT